MLGVGMTTFLALMIIGLIGMVLMAIPGLNRHGHGGLMPHAHVGPAIGHAGHGTASSPSSLARGGPTSHTAGLSPPTALFNSPA